MIKVEDRVVVVGNYGDGMVHCREFGDIGVVEFVDIDNTAMVVFNDGDIQWVGTSNLELVKVASKQNNIKGSDVTMVGKTIIVVGNTGDYHDIKIGTQLEVTGVGFGYIETSLGAIKDVDVFDLSGEVYVHINDLRDMRKIGCEFDTEGNLLYPDGKVALKAQNLKYLNKSLLVKRFKENQIVIGTDKTELCFGNSEIGKIIEFRQ